ncbi:MAG: hypothetical protein NPIRA02_38980 [Nitrospirales bacterium]|nr:MAG: hypothetical protein NPIRA02_38980 [Nitrospirales bacterium]
MNNILSEKFALYKDEYRGFFNSARNYTGYDFGENSHPNVPPPTVTFTQPLQWWSLDRPQRIRRIREARDQYLMDILRLGDGRESCVRKSYAQRRKYKGLIAAATNRSRNFTVHAEDQYAV